MQSEKTSKSVGRSRFASFAALAENFPDIAIGVDDVARLAIFQVALLEFVAGAGNRLSVAA